MKGRFLLLAAMVAVSSACGLWEEQPQVGSGAGAPSGGASGGEHREEARRHPLRLAPVPPVVPWAELPVAGTAPPGARVKIWGTGDTFVPAEVDASGHFCVDVPLTAGGVRRLRAEVEGPDGTEEAFLETARAVLPMIELTPGANAATEGALATSMTADAPLGTLLDGERTTGVTLTATDDDDDAWLWLALPQPIVTDEIVVATDGVCPLTSFTLHTSALGVPGDPRMDRATWGHVGIESSWPVTEIGLPPTPVRHVAISVDDDGCAGAHRLIELQVWVAAGAAPAMAPPRCGQ